MVVQVVVELGGDFAYPVQLRPRDFREVVVFVVVPDVVHERVEGAVVGVRFLRLKKKCQSVVMCMSK